MMREIAPASAAARECRGPATPDGLGDCDSVPWVQSTARRRAVGGKQVGGPRHSRAAALAGALRGNQGGFTLIELLVVIIVLGLLAGLVGPRLFGRVGQSKTATAKAQIELLGAALDQYRLDVGKYPDASQGLNALQQNVANPPGWSGPYLKKGVPNDPWGNPYKYRCCPGQHGDYDLWSEGADNAPGGEGENADVTSWDVGKQ